MKRISVIGNVGGGKTTLCAKLSHTLNIPVYTFDTIQWRPGWKLATPEDITRQHDQWLNREAWIIDGFGGFNSWEWVQARFVAADTIIFIDYPLRIHYWWTLKRHVRYLFRPRPDLPENCPVLPMAWQLFTRIWVIHKWRRPQLTKMIEALRDRKQVIHLRSPQEMNRFLESVQQQYAPNEQ